MTPEPDMTFRFYNNGQNLHKMNVNLKGKESNGNKRFGIVLGVKERNRHVIEYLLLVFSLTNNISSYFS